MRLAPLDWVVIGIYVALAVGIGMALARRAGRNVDEFFLSGRTLPWWITGTSMVATSFAADTPLVVTGWVRDAGIWKNWVWWCFAVSGMLGTFLFARWWRRGGVMTKAELAELRYPGGEGRVLRGTLGVFHSCFTNTIVLCWVMLAAAKILDVLLGIDKGTALLAASAVALLYSVMSGFWGVVLTDLPQFVMAVVGAVVLGVVAWGEVGGGAGVLAAVQAGTIGEGVVAFWPPAGPGTPLDASFWTAPVAALAVYLGVAWWAAENVDGSGIAIQRIAASRDERHGLLASLWFNLAHYALRPWPWIVVALASLVLLPTIEITAPMDGTVLAADLQSIVLDVAPSGADAAAGAPGPGDLPGALPREAGAALRVPLGAEDGPEDWVPRPRVFIGQQVRRGELIARTDSERAYVVMMARYLPAGLLGLAVAALIAAFMSTVDTHVNLAASFFVNDIWRRFVKPGASDAHYVAAARWASVGVLAVAGLMAYRATSISDLFLFFMAFLGGVGPIYLLRWFWWRVRGSHEIVAMLASSLSTTLLTFVFADGWPDGPLTPGGVLSAEGRLCLVALSSTVCALLAIALMPRPDPAALLPFYRRIRPIGAWGPVAALAPEVAPPRELRAVLLGTVSGLAAIFGAIHGVGDLLLSAGSTVTVIAFAVTAAGVVGLRAALRRLS